jgi:hypothetical protein
MQIRDYAVAMAAYNQWMNEKVYVAAAELSDDERKRDLGAAFRSVHGTLNHLLLTDQSSAPGSPRSTSYPDGVARRPNPRAGPKGD